MTERETIEAEERARVLGDVRRVLCHLCAMGVPLDTGGWGSGMHKVNERRSGQGATWHSEPCRAATTMQRLRDLPGGRY